MPKPKFRAKLRSFKLLPPGKHYWFKKLRFNLETWFEGYEALTRTEIKGCVVWPVKAATGAVHCDECKLPITFLWEEPKAPAGNVWMRLIYLPKAAKDHIWHALAGSTYVKDIVDFYNSLSAEKDMENVGGEQKEYELDV